MNIKTVFIAVWAIIVSLVIHPAIAAGAVFVIVTIIAPHFREVANNNTKGSGE